MGEAGGGQMPWDTFPVCPYHQGHRLSSFLLHLRVSALFQETWVCTSHPLQHVLTLHDQTSKLTLVLSSPRHFPAQPSLSPALPISPAIFPAQPRRAAQPGLAPQQYLLQGAAELWALPPQPQPL